MKRRARFILAVLALDAAGAAAQDLEPRSYANAPVGMNFVIFGYGYSTGNILVDQALPIEDGRAKLNNLIGGYVRVVDVFGLSSKILVVLPYTWGTFAGILNGEAVSTSRSNFADPRVQLSVNLVGGPALSGREFAAYRSNTVVGASLRVTVPVGEYDPTKLVNLGSNRWTFRPQIGISHTVRRLTLEMYGSAWIFTDNPNYFGGSSLEQNSIYAVQAHASYTFRPGLWIALDGGFAGGGRTYIDSAVRNTLQENARLGATLSLPLKRQHALKLVFASGIATRIGADFDSVVLAYQFRWGGGL